MTEQSTPTAGAKVKSISLEATIIRVCRDCPGETCERCAGLGSYEEPQGVVAYWHRNPLRRLWVRHVRGIKGRAHPPS